MKRALLRHALAISAASLLATTAYAQSPNANPNATAHGQGRVAEPAKPGSPGMGEKAGEKVDKAADKASDKAKDLKDKAGEKADSVKDGADRTARKAKQHDEQKAKLRTMLKGPMDEATKQELRRHAERLARIDRIKTLADGAKDNDSAERAAKLTTKENARHDKWMEKHVSTSTGTTTTTTPGTTPAAQPDSKGGAK
jgi:hypothetical protein